MLFNSIEFAIFLPVVFLLYWFIVNRKLHIQNALILIASYIFYGWWDWRFLFLIIGSGLIDFFAGKLIIRYPKKRTPLLIVSLLGNLGSLAAFKYSAFLSKNIQILFAAIGIEINLQNHIPEFMYILPVGISFYTFQTLSYTIDVYRGKKEPERHLGYFALYVSFFPQLVGDDTKSL